MSGCNALNTGTGLKTYLAADTAVPQAGGVRLIAIDTPKGKFRVPPTTQWSPSTWNGWPGSFRTVRFLRCPNGSHCSLWDDQEHYFSGLIAFLKKSK